MTLRSPESTIRDLQARNESLQREVFDLLVTRQRLQGEVVERDRQARAAAPGQLADLLRRNEELQRQLVEAELDLTALVKLIRTAPGQVALLVEAAHRAAERI